MASYARTAKKLQSAINQRTGAKLLINTQQWYSEDKGRTVTCYLVKQSNAMSGDTKTYKQTVELFRTYSQVQLVLWLRDYWYELNGWDVPQNNMEWEAVKAQYGK